MSAYALSSLFNGTLVNKGANTESDDTISISSAPEARDDDSVGYGNLFGCDLVPPKEGAREQPGDAMTCGETPSSSPSPSPPSPSLFVIKVNSVILNAQLLASSPGSRSVIRRDTTGGGGGGLSSPRNHSRTCGDNGLSDAIEVHLSVTQSGRTYAAVRTLARIVELSTDLAAEYDPQSAGGTGLVLVKIPELPPEILSTAQGVAPSSGSFGHVYRLLGTIRDSLSDWFATLLAETEGSSSLALASFLWEPLWIADGSATAGLAETRVLLSPDRAQRRGSGIVLAGSSSSDSSASSGSTGSSPRMPGSPGGEGGIPLAFGRRRRSTLRRGSMESISTLGSIDENDIIFF